MLTLNSLKPNQAVGMVGDQDFLGYVIGRMVDISGQPIGKYNIAISNPGKTGMTGNPAIDAGQLVPLAGVKPNSAPKRVSRVPDAPRGSPPPANEKRAQQSPLPRSDNKDHRRSAMSPRDSISHPGKGNVGTSQPAARERRP